MADFERLQMEIVELPTVKGIVPVDILSLPQPLGRVVRGLVRDKAIGIDDLADTIDVTKDQALLLANILVEKGYLLVVKENDREELKYRIHYARMPKHNIPLDL